MSVADVLTGAAPYALACEDALEWLPTLPEGCVDLCLIDPPYFRVKALPWDRQWDKPEGFLAWMGEVLTEVRRVLAPNGSLYVFASPEMGSRVECKVREYFNVLNHITLKKGDRSYMAQNTDDFLRQYVPMSERLIFAEQFGADEIAMSGAGYEKKCDELRGSIFDPLRSYLDQERLRAGVSKEECNVACGFVPNGGMASRKYFSNSEWCLPTPEHYATLRRLFNSKGGNYLCREHKDLQREYADLWQEYEVQRLQFEDLRREYEDLRRPFAVTPNDPHTDVWDFPTVQARPGKHPCEKPLPLLESIINASSRPGDVVMDCFCGSGNTGKAALRLDRRFIGCDKDPHWARYARERIGAKQLHMEWKEAA